MGSRGHSVHQTGLQVACTEDNSWPCHVLVHVSRKRTSETGMSTVAARGQPESLAHAPAVRTHTAVLNQAPRNRTGGGEDDDDDRTHADVQVLQERLQEAGAHTQRPHALMAPRRLDPWAQVLGRRGLHTGASLGDSPGSRVRGPLAGQRPCQAILLGFGGQQARSEKATLHSALPHPCAAGLAPTRPLHVDPEPGLEGQGVPRRRSPQPSPLQC